MNKKERKSHWDQVYSTKQFSEMSWYQARPDISLGFLEQFNLSKCASIIDVGGGDSYFVDFLIEHGFTDITILDISEKAIKKAKQRLGSKAEKVNWIICDASEFIPKKKYDFWHDRAAFHFLTEESEIHFYIENVKSAIKEGGYLILGTFSENGPEKCSGLKVKKYSEKTMTDPLKEWFKKIKCLTIEHLTPSEKIQQFLFCSFQRMTTI